MKNSLLTSIVFLLYLTAFGQIDSNTNTVDFEMEDTNTPSNTGLELPASKMPSLTIPKDKRDPKTNISLGEEEQELLDMTKSDGLMENTSNKAPKAFTKDKEPLPEYAKDQFLGDIHTGADYVNIKYRDHEYVDGDIIRVYVNKDIVQSRVSLGGSFSGFTLALEPGKNVIEFEALNQGSSGPNTAELHVYQENGLIISAKEWNLLTGRKATIVVYKDE
ncbi:MAG: hypothetical protein CL596_07700 [Alteromonas sp.]|nr:hypothetical protein [Alteromonas sp.]MAY22468.1 hypothetical protein [Flavobacteriaceae bacterium]|tara:strand:+ start:3776 stop:4432 length:657 start_codon:yes stop_codon:yes gene_type:complete